VSIVFASTTVNGVASVLLKFTDVVSTMLKPNPVITTGSGNEPIFGTILMSPVAYSYDSAFEAFPFTVTTTFTVEAAVVFVGVGAVAVIIFAVFVVEVAVMPPKVTTVAPVVVSKLLPVIVTVVPIVPIAGDMPEPAMIGSYVKSMELEFTPFVETITASTI